MVLLNSMTFQEEWSPWVYAAAQQLNMVTTTINVIKHDVYGEAKTVIITADNK